MQTQKHITRASTAAPVAKPLPTTAHDDAPTSDIAAQLGAAGQGHSFGAVAVSPAPLGAIQPKLTVGAPDDKYEDEADRVAAQVMRMPDSAVQRMMREDDEDKIRTKPDMQRKTDGSFEAGAAAESRIAARHGGGSPLPETTRAFMEPRFGTHFAGVRVHADAEADQISQDLGARAFTIGSDIYFRQGEYSPSSAGGQELLAHELTHVVQQGRGSVFIQRMTLVEANNLDPTRYKYQSLVNFNYTQTADGNTLWKFHWSRPDGHQTLEIHVHGDPEGQYTGINVRWQGEIGAGVSVNPAPLWIQSAVQQKIIDLMMNFSSKTY